MLLLGPVTGITTKLIQRHSSSLLRGNGGPLNNKKNKTSNNNNNKNKNE